MDSRTRLSAALALVLAALFSSPAGGGEAGRDLGVFGKLYEIREESMLSYVRRRAAGIDMRALRRGMEKKVSESWAEGLSVSLEVPRAFTGRVRYVDPSVRVPSPVYDHRGKMVSPARTVNPLDRMTLSESILAAREDQVAEALRRTQKNGKKPVVLLTDGDLERASGLAGRTVYRASPFILRRLGIEKTPSLVTQEGRRLRVEEMVFE